MAWICVNDLSGSAHIRRDKTSGGNKPDPSTAMQSDFLLARGTLVLEFNLGHETKAPKRLCRYARDEGWHRSFTVFLNPDHSISVEVQQGMARSYVRLSAWRTAQTGCARLSFSWNAPERLGLLTVECLDSGSIRQAVFENPLPLPMGDALRIATNKNAHFDHQVSSAALSDEIEPVGPMPSIAPDTIVETEDGPRPINSLRLGDKVLTARHGYRPVRWILRHDVPATQSMGALRLRSPYLGLTTDVLLAPQQRIMLAGADAEYLFGEDQVMIEAEHLLQHSIARQDIRRFSHCRYQLLLDVHDCIRVGGLWCESAYIGNLAASPEILATTLLAPIPPHALPFQSAMKRPFLRPHETKTLLDAIGA